MTLKQKKGTHFHQFDENNQLAEVIALDHNIHLQRQKNRSGHAFQMTKSYGAVYSVYQHGEEVGKLQTYSRFGKPDQSQIKLLNHLLYTNHWKDILQAITEALQAEISNFTRLDVAIDTRGVIDQHLRNRDQVIAGKLKKVGRAKTSIIERNQYSCEGFNIGTRKSGKILTGYQKGALILDAKRKGRDHKQYIVDYWLDNGLISDPEKIKDVERLELKLTGSKLKEIGGLTLDQLEDPAYLAGLMELQFDNFYQWVEVGTDTNTTRAKAKSIIHAVQWHLLNIKPAFRVAVKKVKNALWGDRMTISQLMREYYVNTKFSFWESCEQAQAQLQYCRLMAERYGISDWFNHKLVTWQNDRDHQQQIKEALLMAQIRSGVAA